MAKTIKFPLKVTITKNTFTKNKHHKWCGEIQYAPKESLQAKFSLSDNSTICCHKKTKKEVQEWVRQYKKEKRYIKDRERWLGTEKYYNDKENQRKAAQRLNRFRNALGKLYS
tara:strand:- start:292 stop:630 length:339 start_codon:yes stop_codon:yes gene_type:complete